MVTDPDVDVVIEVIGGIEPARQLILDALKAGKPVVTANKELLANHGGEIFATAETSGVDVLFEAAVGGGIPLVRPLRESLLGEPIDQVMGIVNGTTNYILTRMTEAGVDYAEALAEAQELGYAEADPTADVEGYDAGAKIAILASIAFGARVVAGDVYHEGISGITADDISFAARNGYVVKLVAIAEKLLGRPGRPARRAGRAGAPGDAALDPPAGLGAGQLQRRVRPGRGRRRADVLRTRRRRQPDGQRGAGRPHRRRPQPAQGLERQRRCARRGADPPDRRPRVGVLRAPRRGRPARRARPRWPASFGAHGVSISSMEQEGLGDEADLVFITHRALERDVQATLRDLRELDVVHHVGSVIRVLDDEPDAATDDGDVKYVSTRGAAPVLEFADVLLAGLARDGGLYVPEAWPELARDALARYADHALRRDRGRGHVALRRGQHRAATTFAALVADAYATFDDPDVVPLRDLGDGMWLAELFHGPTLAFKDVALQLVGRLFDHELTRRGDKVTIVGATSGDTGSAAIEACRDRDAIEIVILHPAGRVSDVQRRQMTTVDVAQRAQPRGRGHLRRLPGPGEGAVRRRAVPRPGQPRRRSTPSTGPG